MEKKYKPYFNQTGIVFKVSNSEQNIKDLSAKDLRSLQVFESTLVDLSKLLRIPVGGISQILSLILQLC